MLQIYRRYIGTKSFTSLYSYNCNIKFYIKNQLEYFPGSFKFREFQSNRDEGTQILSALNR